MCEGNNVDCSELILLADKDNQESFQDEVFNNALKAQYAFSRSIPKAVQLVVKLIKSGSCIGD